MRTLDILPLANDAPMADIDLAAISREACRALSIVILATGLAIALTGSFDDPSLNRWLLLGCAPALSAAVIFPMCERRGLGRMRIAREPTGLVPFLVANLIALCCMKTVGDTVFGGDHWAFLLQILVVPGMLSWMARDAVRQGWIQE